MKCHLLFRGSALDLASEAVGHKLRMRLLGIFRIEKCGVDVGASVVKGREEERGVRCSDHPVTDTRSDPLLILAVAKSRLGQIDRTDRADQVLKGFLGLVQIDVVVGALHYIIHIVV